MGIDQIYAEKQIANEPALEKKSQVRSSVETVAAAKAMFETHFKENGKPKTEEGKRLFKKYEIRSYRYPGPVKRLYRKLRHKLRNVFSKSHRSES